MNSHLISEDNGEMTDIEAFICAIEKYVTDVDRYKVNLSIVQYCRLLRNEFLTYGDPKEIKERFDKIIESKNIAFVLGAGISMSPPFNLPNWSQLLKYAVIDEFLSSYEVGKSINFESIYEILVNESGDNSKDYFGSFDLYELGEFLENCRRDANRQDDVSSFSDIERKTDYEMYGFVERALKRKLDDKNTKEWEKTSHGRYRLKNSLIKLAELKELEDLPLIDYLAKLMESQKVKRIITYNYDNAFEYVCKENKISVKSLFVDDQLPYSEQGGVNHTIYHIHGFVPIFDEDNAKLLDEAELAYEARKLILSEGSYDNMAHASYKWRNTVQIDTFLRHNCLFFGFSATDINFKRIVKLMDWHTEYTTSSSSPQPPVNHFIFMTADDFINNIFGDNWRTIDSISRKITFKPAVLNEQNLYDLDAKLKLLYFTLRLKRKYLRKMHIYPIWMTIHGSKQYINNLFKLKYIN